MVLSNHMNPFSIHTVNVSKSIDGYLCNNFGSLEINILPFHFDMVSKLLLLIYAPMALLTLLSIYYYMGILCNGNIIIFTTLSGLYVVAMDVCTAVNSQKCALFITFQLVCIIIHMQIWVYAGVKLFISSSIIHVLSISIVLLVFVYG